MYQNGFEVATGHAAMHPAVPGRYGGLVYRGEEPGCRRTVNGSLRS
jgi:hypothetical protein